MPRYEPNSDEKTMGMLCPLLGIFTWFIAPLIIWLIKKDESPYIKYWGKASLAWEVACIIACFACIPLFFVFIGAPLLWAVLITRVVFEIIAAVKAHSVEPFKYWFIADKFCREEYEAVFGDIQSATPAPGGGEPGQPQG